MKNSRWIPRSGILVLLVLLLAAFGYAQRRGGRYMETQFSPADKAFDAPDPTRPLDHDVFTFARVRFESWRDYYRRPKWQTDYPDSDMNFSFRLQQLTAIKVNPHPVVVDLDDPRLLDYPFIYMCEPGRIVLNDAEIAGLRHYLDNGGFLMADDFWGEEEWWGFYEQIKRVFPEREPEDVPLSHEIFHCVYDLKERPQIPAIQVAWSGRTWEQYDAREVHYRAIYDDDGRMMVFICHNTDLGDGWEREGVDEWYFREFSEKKAYPLGINIVTYAMTH